MELKEARAAAKEIVTFVEEFREELGRTERRRSCGQYLTGLILPGERKSIEPLAARVAGSDVQALQQFVNQSPWEHEPVQKKLRQLMFKRLRLRRGLLIIDDSGIPKKGEHSVGAARQYCGALGKIANCQNLVSLQFTDLKIHFPLIGRLYMPHEWTKDRRRMVSAGVPEGEHSHIEKWRIALSLVDEVHAEFKPECVVFDAGYGGNREFHAEFDKRELTFVGQISDSQVFWCASTSAEVLANQRGRPRIHPRISSQCAEKKSAKAWGEALKSKQWTTVKLPSGQRVRAIAMRVYESNRSVAHATGPERWLIIEELSDGKIRYFLSNAAQKTSLRQLIIWAHARWTIEQGYQQLKEELGLDHFEGRSWRGFHHHLTLCFMAFCFLVLWRRTKKKKQPHASRRTSAA